MPAPTADPTAEDIAAATAAGDDAGHGSAAPAEPLPVQRRVVPKVKAKAAGAIAGAMITATFPTGGNAQDIVPLHERRDRPPAQSHHRRHHRPLRCAGLHVASGWAAEERDAGGGGGVRRSTGEPHPAHEQVPEMWTWGSVRYLRLAACRDLSRGIARSRGHREGWERTGLLGHVGEHMPPDSH